jgi:hypothetical protein
MRVPEIALTHPDIRRLMRFLSFGDNDLHYHISLIFQAPPAFTK